MFGSPTTPQSLRRGSEGEQPTRNSRHRSDNRTNLIIWRNTRFELSPLFSGGKYVANRLFLPFVGRLPMLFPGSSWAPTSFGVPIHTLKMQGVKRNDLKVRDRCRGDGKRRSHAKVLTMMVLRRWVLTGNHACRGAGVAWVKSARPTNPRPVERR